MSNVDLKQIALYSAGIGMFFGLIADQLSIFEQSGNGEKIEKARKEISEKKQEKLPLPVYEHSDFKFDEVRDILIAGSGAAGCMAALGARWASESVKPELDILLVEKLPLSEFGGETKKSGGIIWIPNNPLMKKDGVIDNRTDAVKHMCKMAYPQDFDESAGEELYYGLSEMNFDKIVNYYETGSRMIEQLMVRGHAPNIARFTSSNGKSMTDYAYSPKSEPENKAPNGRGIGIGQGVIETKLLNFVISLVGAADPFLRYIGNTLYPPIKELCVLSTFGIDLSYGIGTVLADALHRAVVKERITIQADTAVDAVYKDINSGAVNGVRVCYLDPVTQALKKRTIGLRRGVIFATGGFSANEELVKKHITRSGRSVYHTGATRGSTGDFLVLASKLGADLDHIEKIWGCESYLESKEGWIQPNCLFQMRGDSFIVANADGKRIYNEKGTYYKRASCHWYNPQHNKFLFMIGDHRCIDYYATDFQKSWPFDVNNPIYIKGQGLQELAKNIRLRISKIRTDGELVDEWEGWDLTGNFESNLANTIEKFNAYAINGVDEEFGRGDTPSENEWMAAHPSNPYTNKAMHPINTNDTLYAIIICASMIDTKGGPKVDLHGRVINMDGEAIPGIYGAGNAAGSLSGAAYFSGGGTLGAAMVTGYMAGTHCVQNSRTALSSKL